MEEGPVDEGSDPFCRIARGELSAYFVYQDDDIMVILDHMPISKGHLLVITKRHYTAVEKVPPATLVKAWLTASALAKFYREVAGAPGVNVGTNSGRPANQVVFHFHIHVVPRWEPGPPRRGERHELTEGEAREVLAMTRQAVPIIKEYLKVAEALSTQDPPHRAGSGMPSSAP